ncbi:MAG: type II toxin-antitoxin system VapC family toxin [Bryobacteraceae bacterium]
MDCLLDTNILIRGFDRRHPMCRLVRAAGKKLHREGLRLCLAPQNVVEFWAVATRPLDSNGLGIPVEYAARLVRRFKRVVTILSETPEVFPEWERLAVEHRVIGKKAHDARIVAVMNVHGIGRILTFNVGDFARYPGISAVSPKDVVPQFE